MEVITAIVHGGLLAVGLIIPLGIQNIFVFNQGATQPTIIKAFPSIVTASLCDTILIILAVLGVSLLILEFFWLKLIIYIVGFIFLLYMGCLSWKQSATSLPQKHHTFSTKKQILFAMSVSLLNPHAIIDTIAVIGTNSIGYTGYAKLAYTFSCIIVSWIWFWGLAIAGRYLHKIDKHGFWISQVNRIAAVIMWLIGLYIGVQIIALL